MVKVKQVFKVNRVDIVNIKKPQSRYITYNAKRTREQKDAKNLKRREANRLKKLER